MSLRDKIIEKMEETPNDAAGVRRLFITEYEVLADAALAALRPHDAVKPTPSRLILVFLATILKAVTEFIEAVPVEANPNMQGR